MTTAAQVRRAAGETRGQFFCRPARFEIAVAIGKPDYAVGVRDVQELGIITWRIKRDPKWFVQTTFCKDFSRVWLAAAFGIAQHLDLIGSTLHDKDVAVRRGQQKSRIAKAAGVQDDLKSGWNLRLSVRRPANDARRINCQNV